MELISKREVLRIIEEETIDDEYECEDGSWESYIDFQYADAMKRINDLPTIESRPKGKWIDNYSARNEEGFWKCSVCGREISLYNSTEKERTEKYPYCNCGADMRGEE